MSIEIQIPKDPDKVDANNLGELLWWCAHLNINPELLLHIIDDTGASVKSIREAARKIKR